MDVYPPRCSSGTTSQVGAVVWFHPGGFVWGNRTTIFPKWLQRRVNALGIAFISADYRLMPNGSVTAHDIIEDVRDAFAFLRSTKFNSALEFLAAQGKLPFEKFRVDPEAIAVAGSSAGGTAAYFAAMHVSPKPAALLSLFATGGDCLTPHYFAPKTKPFIHGRPLLDINKSKDYVYPFSPSVTSQVISDSPIAFNPPAGPGLPPLPANPKMLLGLLYLQLGTYLDYHTGQHEPSLSAALRAAAEGGSDPESPSSDYTNPLRSVIPPQHLAVFPQFNVDSSWPATLLIHGSEDTSVPVTESKRMYELLQEAGVLSRIRVVEGEHHFFDQPLGESSEAEDAERERKFRNLFDDAASFLKRRIDAAQGRGTVQTRERSRSRSRGRRQ
ncbi:Alpha/Beta hydrolase protein [Rhodocollybia butyracea]|uniref:Alpha/Beta hydrolase protein n=1 Tax=Rhodocollybia butyracea TaxID=206335 RepID=A0A9P5P557_9AGAR|nr:Alpha/Beta hydrolase protein [Rhodocollybia butyracea]